MYAYEAYQKGKENPDLYREYVLSSPYFSFLYALHVDKCERDDTRASACGDPHYAYMYARDVDGVPRPGTRAGACEDPKYAYYYALDADKGPHPETRVAASESKFWCEQYTKNVDKHTISANPVVITGIHLPLSNILVFAVYASLAIVPILVFTYLTAITVVNAILQ